MAIDELPDFTQCTEVAALGCGGKVLFATDDFFAAAEGMLKDNDPIFIPDKYTEFGKWMDGWETRRKRIPGHDWSIIKLAGPTSIKGFLVDTAHFTGNYAPKISIQAAMLPTTGSFFDWLSLDGLAPSRKPDAIGRAASNREFEKISRLKSQDWTEIVPVTELKPGYEDTRYTYIQNTEHLDKYTHLRINMFPDGGIARLRVYGDIELDLTESNNSVIDVLGLQNGGRCLQYSNAHFGHPKNLNKPARGVNMGDGWETARRLDRPSIIEMTEKDVLNVPGSEWAIFRLASKATIASVEVDTNHFKGNAPEYVTVEGSPLHGDFSTNFDDTQWTVIVDKAKLQPHKVHSIKREIKPNGPFGSIKITMAPDGGISRVRILGQVFVEKPEDIETAPTNTANAEVDTKTNGDENSDNVGDDETDANTNGDAMPESNADKEANTDQKPDTNEKSEVEASQ